MAINKDSLIAPDKTLWEKANTPLVGPDKPTEEALEALKKEHPWLTLIPNLALGAATSTTSPLGLGLMVGTAGSNLATRMGVGGVADAMNLVNKGVGMTTAAHGLHRAGDTEATPAERVGGLLEAGVGGLGMMTGHKGGPSGPTDYTKPEGLRVAVDTLSSQRGKPGTALFEPQAKTGEVMPEGKMRMSEKGNAVPTTADEIAMHKAVDQETLARPRGTTAIRIFGKEGRPDIGERTKTGEYVAKQPPIIEQVKADEAVDKYRQQAVKSESAVERAKGAEPEIVQKERMAKQPLLSIVDRLRKGLPISENERQQVYDEVRGYPKGVVAKELADANKTVDNLRKARGQADAENERRGNAKQREILRNANETARSEKAREKYIKDNLIQDTKNEKAVSAYKNKADADTAARLRQEFIDKQKEGKEQVTGSVTEGIRGQKDAGEHGGTESTSVRYVEPAKSEEGGPGGGGEPAGPPKKPEDTGYFDQKSAEKAMSKAGYDPADWIAYEVDDRHWRIGRRPGSLTPEQQAGLNEHMNGVVNGDNPPTEPPDGVGPEGNPKGPKPSGGGDGSTAEDTGLPHPATRKYYSSKAKAQTIAEAFGGTVHQVGPRRYRIDMPMDERVPVEPEPPAPQADIPTIKFKPNPAPAESVRTEAPSRNWTNEALTNEEAKRYRDTMPMPNVKRTPEETADFIRLQGKINDFKAANSGEPPAAGVAPEAPPVEPSTQEPTAPPFVAPTGEAEPVLPGVEPTVNPPAAPVAEAPFSLTSEAAKPKAPTGPDLFSAPESTPPPTEPDLPPSPEAPTPETPGAIPFRFLVSKGDSMLTPREQAGVEYSMMKDLKKAGLATEEGRRASAEKTVALNAPEREKFKQGVYNTADEQFKALGEQLSDPNTPENEKGLLRTLIERLIKEEEGSMAIPSNEDAVAGIRRAGTFLNNARRSALLNPYSVAKKGAGDVQGMGLAMAEHPDRAGDLISSFFKPDTIEAFKAGWHAPTKGMEEVSGLEDLFAHEKNPLTWSGRSMAGLTSAFKDVYNRAGFTPEEAQAYTLTKTPSRLVPAALYETFNKPILNHFNPFTRIAANWLEQGWEHSPFILGELGMKWNELSPDQRAMMFRKAAIGTGAGYAANQLTPDDFVEKHPVASRIMTAGPLGAPILFGMAMKNQNNTPVSKSVQELTKEMPGVRLASDLKDFSVPGFAGDYLGSYTNFMRPIAEMTDTVPQRDVGGKGLTDMERITRKTLANIPGLRQTLPVRYSGDEDMNELLSILMEQQRQQQR